MSVPIRKVGFINTRVKIWAEVFLRQRRIAWKTRKRWYFAEKNGGHRRVLQI